MRLSTTAIPSPRETNVKDIRVTSDKADTVAILGATSLVGEPLVRLLVAGGTDVLAYSRRARAGGGARWRQLEGAPIETTDCWISVMPIWALPAHFARIEASGARRIVQLSSTSQFTKLHSPDPAEAAVAKRLVDGEAALRTWAEARGIAWTILRPTLIYGAGRDRNVSEIARFIRRFGFFPLLGKATGLRQPVAAEDVARACVEASRAPLAANRAYNISGGETLSYRAMVERVFASMGRKPVTPSIPLALFAAAVVCLRLLPRYRHWTPAMAERMNTDMVFDHGDAARDFGYAPGPFGSGPFL